MTKISDQILNKIRKEKICPFSKWKFLAKESCVWASFMVALLVGSLSLAVMTDILVDNDWDIYFYLHKSFLQYIFMSLPYVWIVFFIAFLWTAFYFLIHIRGWYRHRFSRVMIALLASVSSAGLIFFYSGLGKRVDNILTRTCPHYDLVKLEKKELWNRPDDGLLSGDIIGTKGAEEFVLKDFTGKRWEIFDRNSQINGKYVHAGAEVEIIGARRGESVFDAKEIRDIDSDEEIYHKK